MDLYHLASSCKGGWEKCEVSVAEHEVADKVEPVQKWITSRNRGRKFYIGANLMCGPAFGLRATSGRADEKGRKEGRGGANFDVTPVAPAAPAR